MSSRSSAVPRPLRARCDSGSTVASPTRSTRASSRMLSPVATPSCTRARATPVRHQSPARVVRAAAQAGAQMVVYLSSMAVHGWNPGRGRTRRLLCRAANRSRTTAGRPGRAPCEACRETGTRFVILRPGIVYGPRSQWIAGFARAVVEGSASVVADGRGVCNAIYVDNLVHAVDLALEREEAADEAFLVADDDPSPGGMLYEPVCRALGHSWTRSPTSCPARRDGRRPSACSSSRRIRPRAVLDRVPRAVRNPIRRLAVLPLPSLRRPAKADARDVDPADLRLQVPDHKARRMLGFEPPVAFDEACRRTVAWLGFAGYPLAAAARACPMTQPLVSAVTIVRDGERFLAEAIESALDQTYRNLELIVVDDGSTDSAEIAERFARAEPGRVRLVRHADGGSRGMSAARTLGAAAHGALIGFLDADDVWLPDKIAEQVAVLDAYPAAGMVYGRTQMWYSWDANRVRSDYFYDLGVAPDRLYPPSGCCRSCSRTASSRRRRNALIRREAYEEAAGSRQFSGSSTTTSSSRSCTALGDLRLERLWAATAGTRRTSRASRRRFSYARYYRERRAFLEWLRGISPTPRSTPTAPRARVRAWRARHPYRAALAARLRPAAPRVEPSPRASAGPSP